MIWRIWVGGERMVRRLVVVVSCGGSRGGIIVRPPPDRRLMITPSLGAGAMTRALPPDGIGRMSWRWCIAPRVRPSCTDCRYTSRGPLRRRLGARRARRVCLHASPTTGHDIASLSGMAPM
jgi:hypothetical protein